MLSTTIKENKLSKYQNVYPLFLFPEGEMHQNQHLFSFLCHSFAETIFNPYPANTEID